MHKTQMSQSGQIIKQSMKYFSLLERFHSQHFATSMGYIVTSSYNHPEFVLSGKFAILA